MKKFESKQFNELDDAKEYFYKMVEIGYPYVCLLFSIDYYSEGYWVENSEPHHLTGYIIRKHDIAIIRNNKIDLLV